MYQIKDVDSKVVEAFCIVVKENMYKIDYIICEIFINRLIHVIVEVFTVKDRFIT